MSDLGSFNKTLQPDGTIPVKIDKSFNVFNKTLSCSAHEQAKLNIDINAAVNAEVTFGVIVAGALIPPNIKELLLFSGMTSKFP